MDVIKHQRRRRRQATLRQIKAIKYLSEGMSKRAAMMKAGYAVTTAMHEAHKLTTSTAVEGLLDKLKDDLAQKGLTTDKIADKFVEWLDAQRTVGARVVVKREGGELPTAESRTDDFIEVPDYDTQIKAYDRWKGIMDSGDKKDKGIKRKLTIEEFISDS